MDLSRSEPSKNFIDRTGIKPSLKHRLDMFLYHLMRPSEKRKQDEFLRRAEEYKKNPRDYSKMTVSDFTPDEWDMVRENGFSLDDILVMREYRNSMNKKNFRVEEDGSISRRK
jgi:hypothetical protein